MHKENKRSHLGAEPRRKKVRVLRAQGYTWVEIGKKLGVTPQRAQQLGKSSNG